jgi:glycosyltransferase involved in cell wall biosynthesis
LYSARRRLIDSLMGRCNDAFVAVSAFVKDSAIRNLGLPGNKITIIPNSVDTEVFQEIDPKVIARKKEEFGILPEDKVLLTVGRVDPAKGHRYLLESLPVVKRFFPTVKLLIVGDGPSRSSLEELSQQMGNGRNVLFSGIRQDVREVLSLCDIFVFPTLSEGLPVALLEAMVLKRPCVASRIPPVEEVIQEGVSGLLVPARSADGLAKAILYLLRNPEKGRAMAERARVVVTQKFSARRSAEALQSFYLDLAAGGWK